MGKLEDLQDRPAPPLLSGAYFRIEETARATSASLDVWFFKTASKSK
jgi:hypothetical protein